MNVEIEMMSKMLHLNKQLDDMNSMYTGIQEITDQAIKKERDKQDIKSTSTSEDKELKTRKRVIHLGDQGDRHVKQKHDGVEILTSQASVKVVAAREMRQRYKDKQKVVEKCSAEKESKVRESVTLLTADINDVPDQVFRWELLHWYC